MKKSTACSNSSACRKEKEQRKQPKPRERTLAVAHEYCIRKRMPLHNWCQGQALYLARPLLPDNMFTDRVHPDALPEPHFSPSPDLPDTPRSSASSAQNFIPKHPPSPGDYVVQVQKDQIFRVPPPENARRMATYARRSASRRRRSSCLCCLAWAAAPFLILLLLATATPGVLYLVLRPAQPAYSIDALPVTGFNLSSSASAVLSPAFLATVRAENPNKKIGIYYLRGSDVTASYGGVRLCHGEWPAFFQERRNVTTFKMTLTGSGIRLSSAMRQDLLTAQNRRQVPLRIDVKVPVRVKVGSVTSWTVTVKVRCDVTVDKLTADSKVVSESCSLKL
ncbi:NDR1/HIN1-like protein 13 [Canna indica]|uniref:NDR1/HIN1-like protein 13 n=1 Tax=Canna indica TaxID=4628 RepID=A0AAQ3Q4B9_9LILI|nr:NDR1/HIN1-like protein 13 [Canna indica]